MINRQKVNGQVGTVVLLVSLLLGAAFVGTLAFNASVISAQTEGDKGTQNKNNNEGDDHAESNEGACTRNKGEKVAITTAKLIVEYNFTDGDLGVHGQFDDTGWSMLCVYDPNGKQVLAVSPRAQLKDLTMASLFFESREPPLGEFSFADLKAKFPEGQYEVRAISFDGTNLIGSATFSHDIPAPPTITAPALAEAEESAGDAVFSSTDLVIEWEDVTETVDGGPITITGYEVIIVKVEYDDPNGFSRPIFDVHVGPNQNSLTVPVEFLEPDTVYELEVLGLEESGNQTITVGFFKTNG